MLKLLHTFSSTVLNSHEFICCVDRGLTIIIIRTVLKSSEMHHRMEWGTGHTIFLLTTQLQGYSNRRGINVLFTWIFQQHICCVTVTKSNHSVNCHLSKSNLNIGCTYEHTIVSPSSSMLPVSVKNLLMETAKIKQSNRK